MAYSPQDVYARHLASRRGYPLWTPEPDRSLPDVYIREGLKIGDVGVVVPEDGSFDVFFNICLPEDHPLHRETGVPDNFTHIPLGGRDVATFPEAEGAGRVISTSSMVRVKNKHGYTEDADRRAQPGLNYEFTLSSREGAVLILPEGAERYHLRNERVFMDEAIRHAVDWYAFAEQRLGRIISHDSLYLITGFYKARSWSLASYQQSGGAAEASAQFKAMQIGQGNIAASYTWETTHAMDWRVGPSNLYYQGIPNQTAFIQGFKIAVREGILGMKRVNVKADFPSVRTYHGEFSGGSRFLNPWGASGRSANSGGSATNTRYSKKSSVDATEGDLPSDEIEDGGVDITIQRFPQVAKPFHPSDIINQFLLEEAPSATVAVTHDSQWIALLETGLLNAEELPNDGRLREVISSCEIMFKEGAAYLNLEGTTMDDEVNDDDVTAMSKFSKGPLQGNFVLPQLSDPAVAEGRRQPGSTVAGFFGEDKAISAMATVHPYKGRRWLGWFNSLRSYTIARCFGKMANSLWDRLSPSYNDSPAVSFGLDGMEGPKYIAALSGAKIRTGHLAYLAMERGKEVKQENLRGRETVPCDVAYLAMKHVDYDTRVRQLPLDKALYGLLPITVSVVTCVVCALVYDWVSLSMILISIISSGWASLVIGRGRLIIKSVKEPASGAPPGHGILIGKDGMMVIKGEERDVNAITKGRFVLEANPDPKQSRQPTEETDGKDESKRWWRKQGSEGGTQDDKGKQREAVTKAKKQVDERQCHNHATGVCSLLVVQSFLQFLFSPQGADFGQIMFLISLSASWMYSSYLSSFAEEKIQAQILFQALGDPQIRRFRAGTRTAMVVFTCLLLFHKVKSLSKEEDYDRRVEILEECLPNETKVWRKWKKMVADQLVDLNDTSLSHLKESDEEPQLLKELLWDARTAFEEYFSIRGELPADSAEGGNQPWPMADTLRRADRQNWTKLYRATTRYWYKG